jgi:hypothetical protein
LVISLSVNNPDITTTHTHRAGFLIVMLLLVVLLQQQRRLASRMAAYQNSRAFDASLRVGEECV